MSWVGLAARRMGVQGVRCARASALSSSASLPLRRGNQPGALGSAAAWERRLAFSSVNPDSYSTPGWTPGPGVLLDEELTLQKARSWDEAAADGFKAATFDELFKGKKVVLFAVPGAFTGVCENAHVPSFSKNIEAFKAKGVEKVMCVAVNDPYCLNAWKNLLGSNASGVEFYSDHDLSFTRWMHADRDCKGAALGPSKRSNRYAMVLDNGTIQVLLTEASTADLKVSDGDSVLSKL